MEIKGLDVGALIDSTNLNLQTEVGAAVLAKNLDIIDEQGQAMIKMMETSVNPNLGANFDIRV